MKNHLSFVEIAGAFVTYRGSPPWVFCKIAILIEQIRKIRKRTPVLDSLSNKVASYMSVTLLKRDFSTGVFLQIL